MVQTVYHARAVAGGPCARAKRSHSGAHGARGAQRAGAHCTTAGARALYVRLTPPSTDCLSKGVAHEVSEWSVRTQQATLGELKRADAPIMSLFTNADGTAVVDLKKFYIPK